MAAPHSPAGYQVVPLPKDGEGRLRQGSMFCCSRCAATITIPLPNGKTNPEMQARRAIRAGWRADAFHPGKNRCPEHNPKAPAVTLTNDTEIKITQDASPSPAAATVRPLTTDEKFKVRQMLDKHFDDSRGAYLDSFSDKKIGDTLNIPWAAVAQMREVGWGPIRSNPEVDALKQELASIQKEIGQLAMTQSTISRKIETAVERVETALARLAKLDA